MNGSVCVLITCYLPKHVVGLHSIEMGQKEAQSEGGATQRSLKRLRGDEAEPSVAGCKHGHIGQSCKTQLLALHPIRGEGLGEGAEL